MIARRIFNATPWQLLPRPYRAAAHFLPPGWVASRIDGTGGAVFYVKFIKRGDNEIREMTCRTGVHKGVKKGPNWREEARNMLSGTTGVRGSSYDPDDHGLIRVFDMGKLGYRMIPAESVLELRYNGMRYVPTPYGYVDGLPYKRKHTRRTA